MLMDKGRDLVRVLVVESDEYNIRVADSFLYACGYTNVVVARSEKEALERFIEGVGLIILNVASSKFKGFEVYKKLRQAPRGRGIPIIACTPKGKGIRTQCFKAGMNGVMPSPTSFNEFKCAVSSSLG
jgi:CheY-like chemotaxis protein